METLPPMVRTYVWQRVSHRCRVGHFGDDTGTTPVNFAHRAMSPVVPCQPGPSVRVGLEVLALLRGSCQEMQTGSVCTYRPPGWLFRRT